MFKRLMHNWPWLFLMPQSQSLGRLYPMTEWPLLCSNLAFSSLVPSWFDMSRGDHIDLISTLWAALATGHIWSLSANRIHFKGKRKLINQSSIGCWQTFGLRFGVQSIGQSSMDDCPILLCSLIWSDDKNTLGGSSPDCPAAANWWSAVFPRHLWEADNHRPSIGRYVEGNRLIPI